MQFMPVFVIQLKYFYTNILRGILSTVSSGDGRPDTSHGRTWLCSGVWSLGYGGAYL